MTTVDLAPQAVDIVLAILARYVPDREVLVIGSRSSGRPRPFSDPDLVVMGEWASTSDDFRRVIATQARPFRPAGTD